MDQDWYKVGWVRDAHGIKGEIYVQLLSKQADWLEGFATFRLEPKGTAQQSGKVFSSKRVKPHKHGLIILPEGFKTRNESELWKGADFLIPRDLLVSDESEAPYLVEFEGFKVIDRGLGDVGQVIGFLDNGAHDLLIVKRNDDREVLIPFVDAFTESVDKERKILNMILPEGLMDED